MARRRLRFREHPDMTLTTWMRWLGPVLVVALLALACWVLWHQLAGLDAVAVGRAFASIPIWRCVVGAILLLISFAGYAWLERLATGHFERPLSPPKAFALAVAAQGLSLTTGKGFVVAGAVRVRLLGRWGFTVMQSLVVTAIVTLHGNAGMMVLMAILCFAAGPWSWAPWVGCATLAGAGAWLLSCWKSGPMTIGKVTITLPTIPMALRGIAAGGGEKLACILLAVVVQPAGPSIPVVTFLAVIVVALALARLSQVPGGIGVLEASMLSLWPVPLTDAAKVDLVAGMLAFRVAYYLVPLAASLPVLAFLGWRRTVSA